MAAYYGSQRTLACVSIHYEEFGLLIRGEQVDDCYRSTPVLLGREWEEGFDDVTTTRIPASEWRCQSGR
ncbi:hypothetical protein [Streptomyces sp. NPDC053720]|uniref:hypothetical protein n=1 Tax=Streptomyces sp. NPDC053720 TaxID=3154855 RepID=UPI003448A828